MKTWIILTLAIMALVACDGGIMGNRADAEESAAEPDMAGQEMEESYNYNPGELGSFGSGFTTAGNQSVVLAHALDGNMISQTTSQNSMASIGKKKPAKTKQPKSRKMIWAAQLKFQVKSVDASSKAIQEITEQFGGFVSNMDLTTTNYKVANTIRIRISNNKFNALLEEIKKESRFMDELKIHSNDVTEEFIDIQIRLKTKKQVRDRYIDILRNKTGKIKDVIAAEEAIRKITEEIESKEGRLRYLRDKVNYSTITATLYETVEFKQEPKIFEKPYTQKLVAGFGNGWGAITGFVLLLANIWPLLLVVSLLTWRWKWIMRRF